MGLGSGEQVARTHNVEKALLSGLEHLELALKCDCYSQSFSLGGS